MSDVRGQVLSPLATGGGQEFGLRSGTENVPGIVGFAEAVRLIAKDREKESEKIAKLRNYFWQGLKKIYPEAELNGHNETQNIRIRPNITKGTITRNTRICPNITNKNHSTNSGALVDSGCGDVLPSILNVYFPSHEAQFLLTKLDMAGVAASSGSACRSRAVESSYVIEALGYSKERANHSIRFSFGRPTTKKELDTALKIIKNSI